MTEEEAIEQENEKSLKDHILPGLENDWSISQKRKALGELVEVYVGIKNKLLIEKGEIYGKRIQRDERGDIVRVGGKPQFERVRVEFTDEDVARVWEEFCKDRRTAVIEQGKSERGKAAGESRRKMYEQQKKGDEEKQKLIPGKKYGDEWAIKCVDCGRIDTVRFNPQGGGELRCKRCYKKHRSQQQGRGGGNRRGGGRQYNRNGGGRQMRNPDGDPTDKQRNFYISLFKEKHGYEPSVSEIPVTKKEMSDAISRLVGQ